MPGNSPYKIVLSKNEQKQLESIAREYTSPYFYVVRAKIVLHAAEGMDNKEIGYRLDLPRQIVSKWRKRFFESRLDSLADQPRKGRPPLFSPSSRY